jgi:hypothetical protein
MLIGDPSMLAIESEITLAVEQLGQRGLGFFVIHVGGRRYGVHEPDATMLACSFDGVEQRIANRGQHTAPFATEMDPRNIAHAFREAMYSDEPTERYLDIPLDDFESIFHTQASTPVWAPDGDEAFDDGSYVLQFDVEDRVRLIAFQSSDQDSLYDPDTLRDVWLPAEEYYRILQQWRDAFERQWTEATKST